MRRRVLVADDEPLTAEMLAVILGHRGYEGEEALKRALELQPDAILLDVLMPKLDGDAIAQQLKQHPAMADKVIVLVSCVDEHDVDWRGVGADAFLQKPINLKALPALV